MIKEQQKAFVTVLQMQDSPSALITLYCRQLLACDNPRRNLQSRLETKRNTQSTERKLENHMGELEKRLPSKFAFNPMYPST
jgi:hypothetical protein